MPGPRTCLVFPHVGLGGGEVAMMEVAEGLRRQLDLEVCAVDNAVVAAGETLRGELAERFGAVTFVRRRWELRPCFRRAEAVLWYGVVNGVPAVLAAMGERPASVRVVHTSRQLDGARFHRRWRRMIDATVCVSPAIARTIPGAVFIPNPAPERHLRGPRREFFPPGRKTLGFLGRLVPLKNVPWLIENLERLGCNLLLQAFDTPLLTAAELRGLADRLGVADRVRFLEPCRDVGTLLRSVDALVIASAHEGFPMVAIEAGILGVPVISTRVGALPELFAEEVLFVDSEGGRPVAESLRAVIEGVGPEQGWRLAEKVACLCAREKVVARYAEVLRSAHGGER
jgi:glycosyltransferase involved in cell wall biosynthesis